MILLHLHNNYLLNTSVWIFAILNVPSCSFNLVRESWQNHFEKYSIVLFYLCLKCVMDKYCLSTARIIFLPHRWEITFLICCDSYL